jgi:hypothetical protein
MVGSQYFYSVPGDWQSCRRSKAILLNTGRDIAAEGEVGESGAGGGGRGAGGGGVQGQVRGVLVHAALQRVMACDFLQIMQEVTYFKMLLQ